MRSISKKATVVAGVLAAVAMIEDPAHAFSTGGHFTATERGLTRAGFKAPAIRAAQAANYYVDHMVNTKDVQFAASSPDQKAKNISLFFHFDSLWDAARVEREFAWMERASRTMVLDAKSRRDPQAILNALGITLHAIQDFYSHSMFADVEWPSWKGTRIVTIDDLPRDLWENPLMQGRWTNGTSTRGLLSGHAGSFYGSPPATPQNAQFPTHGDAFDECELNENPKGCGLNHDGARRRNSLVAIMMAAEASYDVAKRFEGWVADPALWAAVTGFAADAGVNAAWYRAHRMSAAAGQWGYERPISKVFQATQLLSAWHATRCPSDIYLPLCPMNIWESKWYPVIIGMFQAGAPGTATGGGAPSQPTAGTPIFELPAPTTNVTPYAGSYDVIWGNKRGALDITIQAGRVAGSLGMDNKLWTIESTTRVSGVDIRATSGGVTLSGKLFPTGPRNDLTGFLRDGASGIPDGFVATRTSKPRVTPTVLPNTAVRK